MANKTNGVTYETRCDKVDWDVLKVEVMTKLEYLRVAWAATERETSPALHNKIVEDLYIPAVRLLAEFCECLEVIDDGKVPANGSEMRQ